MTQAREAKKRTADPLERKKLEEHQPDETSRQHSLLHLQRAAGNRAVVHLLESHGQLQTKLRISGLGDEHEQEADRAAEQVLRLTSASTGVVQRKCSACSPAATCAECAEEEETVQRKTRSASVFSSAGPVMQRKAKNSSVLSSTAPHIQRAPSNGESTNAAISDAAIEPAAVASASGPLIVEDEATSVTPGQMRKSDFLEQLRSTVCTTADEALKEAGQSTEGCPYIEKWLDYYSGQEPAHIERALRKYAPEAASATTARDIIPAVSNRVRVAVDRWARTGEITGIPPEMAGMLPGAGGALGAVAGMIGGAVAGIGSAIGGAVSAAAGAVGSVFSSIGSALFKRKESVARAANHPQEIRAQLSGGQSLDGRAQSRMGAAFGKDFSQVRVHTDPQAAGLSDSLNARAFTIGSDITFAAGEYQPGTLIGDALIAHELAHVVQQGGGSNGAKPLAKGEAEDGTLEEDADRAAVEAVVSTWEGDRGMLSRPAKRSTWTTLRAGLRLQRCGGHEPAEPKTRYEFFLLEGREKLKKIGFGVQWTEFCQSKARKADGTKWDGYDTDYWVKQEDPVFGCKLVTKTDHTPSEAVRALFDPERRDRWQVDCGQFVQLTHYYALLHTLTEKAGNEKAGGDLFDQRIGSIIELRQVSSTGLKTRMLWGKDRPEGNDMQEFERVPGERFARPKPDGMVRNEAEVLREAPTGSRVVFTSTAIMKNENYRVENTMKVGDNLYSAHPLEKGILTREEIVEEIAKAADNPEMAKSKIYISEIEIYDLP